MKLYIFHFHLVKIIWFLSAFFSLTTALSQTPVIIYPAKSDQSPRLDKMEMITPIIRDKTWKNKIVKNRFEFLKSVRPSSDYMGQDPVLQKEYNTSDGSNPPFVNFDGTINRNGVAPPDTDGDVGLNHYFQMINSSFSIFNKSGNLLYGPADNSTIWQGFIGPWTGTNDGDPVVLYDRFADRWLVSQFAVNTSDDSQWELVAVSQTADPTGSWYRYAFQFTYMPDYPKLSIWPDGYYLSVNQFQPVSPYNWIGGGAAALNRSKMLSGDPTAEIVFFSLGSNVGSLLPSDADGTPPPTGTPNYFTFFNSGGLHIYAFQANWITPASSTITNISNLSVAAFSNSGISVTQKGVTQILDNLADRLMFRQQYRNFGSYQVLLNNHTVNVGSGRAGIRWYELRNYGTGWAIHQQGTYAPDDANHRWMASIAMNAEGNIALGYSVSGADVYPSIRYTGRFSDDAPGTMSMPEEIIYSGLASQTGVNRWGDYSCMSVDPANNTSFWYTTEYTTGGWNWKTRIAAFDISPSFPVANFQADITNACTDQTVSFLDQTSGQPTSWQWTFNPPSVEFVEGTNSSTKNPKVKFLDNGLFSITLTATNYLGSSSKTLENYISIGGSDLPASQNFESAAFPPTGFRIVNPDNGTTWSRNTAARGNGSSQAATYIDFYNYISTGQLDDLVVPNIDLFNYNTAQLSFNVAYRRYSASYPDTLKIFISTNCGESYELTPIYNKSGTTLATGVDQWSQFTPSSASDWRLEAINLSNYIGQQITLKFKAVNGYGNNLYIDDIQLSGTLAPLSANFLVSDSLLCTGTSTTFTNNSSGPVRSINWTFPGGIPSSSTEPNPSVVYPEAGIYNVGLQISNSQNTNSITRTGYIKVNEPTVITKDPENITVHKGEALSENIEATNGLTYQWFKNGELIPGNNSSGYHVPLSEQSDEGFYQCIASNYCNADTSEMGFVDIVFRIEGNLYYLNASQTPINNAEVFLSQNNVLLMNDSTNSSGVFIFDSLQPGDYTLKPAIDINPGGFNATDALLVSLHTIGYPGFGLTGLLLQAADVNDDGNVNSTDALNILQRTVQMINTFPAGNWIEVETDILIANDHINQNTQSLCYGDVNASYMSNIAKSGQFNEINYINSMYLDPGEDDFVLPVELLSSEETGAFTLNFTFASEKVKLLKINSPLNNLVFSIEENCVRMAWFGTHGSHLNEMINFEFIFKRINTLEEQERIIGLMPGSEIVNCFGFTSEYFINVPYVSVLPIQNKYFLGQNYPNPFNRYTTVDFYLPEKVYCELNVFGLAGNKVKTIVSEILPGGAHQVQIEPNELLPGIYEYRLEIFVNNSVQKVSRRMVFVR